MMIIRFLLLYGAIVGSISASALGFHLLGIAVGSLLGILVTAGLTAFSLRKR